jgi:hypothetical protein
LRHFEAGKFLLTLAPMTPQQFITKWQPVALTERATAQTHFIDLCALVGHDDPVTADPRGESFAFEKGVADAYGWPADISEEDALARLLDLNLARAAAGKPGMAASEAGVADEEE